MTPRLNPVKYAIEVVERDDGEKDFRVWMDARDGRGPIDRPKINIVGEQDRDRYGFYLKFLAEDSVAECLGSERDLLQIGSAWGRERVGPDVETLVAGGKCQ